MRRAVRLKLPHGRREFHDGPLAARAAPNLSYGANVLRVSGRPLREPPHAFGVRWEPYDLVLLRPSSHGSHGSLGFIGKARTISRPRVTRPASMPDTRCAPRATVWCVAVVSVGDDLVILARASVRVRGEGVAAPTQRPTRLYGLWSAGTALSLVSSGIVLLLSGGAHESLAWLHIPM